MATGASTDFSATEARLESRSAVLRKELGFADLVFAQILMVMVPEFFGTAVKAGLSHVFMWLAAILLFFIPQTLLVAHLNRLMPLEGGLYEWVRVVFNDRIGFLVAANLWLSFALQVAQIGLVTMSYVAYAIGPQADWIASNKWVLAGGAAALIAALAAVARLGLGVGKRFTNAGSFTTLIALITLVAAPILHPHRAAPHEYRPFPLVLPPLTLASFSVFAKMTFGALSGFEYVAIFAGEARSPARNLARSVLFTAPLIALLYVLGTSSLLAFVSPDNIDLVGPIPQALRLAFRDTGMAGVIAPVVILLLLMNYLCSYALYVSGSSRLPMVAGWDHLLPTWFTRLHVQYKTPVNSILFVGGVSLAGSLAVLVGVGQQESFALLQIWIWTLYALAYLVMFAIPLLAPHETGIRMPLWLRIMSASGFLVTLLFILLSVYPITPVASKPAYVLKVITVIVGVNLGAVLLYRFGLRRLRPARAAW